jgi:hypothetical protein
MIFIKLVIKQVMKKTSGPFVKTRVLTWPVPWARAYNVNRANIRENDGVYIILSLHSLAAGKTALYKSYTISATGWKLPYSLHD